MTKKTCSQCGNPLTKGGAKFCTTCGATVDGAETDSAMSMETRPLLEEQTDQTVSAIAATEVLPEKMAPVNYETEEMPQTKITAQAEKSATAVVANPPVTQPQKKREEAAPANRLSGGRKGLLLAAAFGVVALAAVSFFFVISRGPSETQAENRPADKTEPSTATQPIAQAPNQPSSSDANNQAQPQSGPAIDAVKSPAVNNTSAASNPQKPAVAKPTPTTPQEKQAAVGASAEHNKSQGITYLGAGRYQEALAEFERVKRLDPGNKDVYYLIGSTYQRMNQLEQALEAYRQCTSGVYASVAQNAVKKLEKKVSAR